MARARSSAAWRALRHGARLLEAGLLGRGHAPVDRVVERAIRLGGGCAWCMRCGATLVAECDMPPAVDAGQGPRCEPCLRRPAFDGFVRLGRYETPLGALARRVKRQGWHRAADALGLHLALEVRARMALPAGGWCVVPVPGSLLRRLARGIDHTHALARAVARELDAPFVPALALGISGRQAGLDRRSRLRRRRRMRVRSGFDRCLRGRFVLLVDDVRTTGSTLQKARELLQSAGSEIVVPAVICVADRRKNIQEMALRPPSPEAPGPGCRKLVHIENPLKEGC